MKQIEMKKLYTILYSSLLSCGTKIVDLESY